MYLGISTGLAFFSGICSGLTGGYLALDELVLELKLENGTEIEKKLARKVLPIRK
jgi:hypothetical protein